MYVTLREAKSHLSRLIHRAVGGDDIIVTRAGKPVVRMIAYQEAPPKRVPGIWKGKVKMSRDFGELPESIAAAFRGERASLNLLLDTNVLLW